MKPNEMAQLLTNLTRIWKVFGLRFKVVSLSLLQKRYGSIMLSKGNITNSEIR
jgi:hypothetical protein